jgi:hypothetical protein
MEDWETKCVASINKAFTYLLYLLNLYNLILKFKLSLNIRSTHYANLYYPLCRNYVHFAVHLESDIFSILPNIKSNMYNIC